MKEFRLGLGSDPTVKKDSRALLYILSDRKHSFSPYSHPESFFPFAVKENAQAVEIKVKTR